MDQSNSKEKSSHCHDLFPSGDSNAQGDTVNSEECCATVEPEVSESNSECCATSESSNDSNVSCHSTTERRSHHSEKTKRDLITRLNRVEGQIRGIKGLIERDTYCDDVITQISATQAALNSVAKILLDGHLRSCVVNRIQAGDQEIIDELLTTIQRLMKK